MLAGLLALGTVILLLTIAEPVSAIPDAKQSRNPLSLKAGFTANGLVVAGGTIAGDVPTQFQNAVTLASAEDPRYCGTSSGKGYDSLYVTRVSCRAGVRLAVEWRRKAFGGEGKARVHIGRWQCKRTQERGEGPIVRCTRGAGLVAWYPAPPNAPSPGFQIDCGSRGSLLCQEHF